MTLFSNRDLRSLTAPGGTGDARLGLGGRSYVGAEFACVGAVIPLRHSGSKLVSTGGEAILRLQHPRSSPSWLVEPFVLVGLGWSRLTLTDGDQGVIASDAMGDVLLGGGLTLGRGRLLLDGRVTYRASFHEHLRIGGVPVKTDRWTLAAYVGCTL